MKTSSTIIKSALDVLNIEISGIISPIPKISKNDKKINKTVRKIQLKIPKFLIIKKILFFICFYKKINNFVFKSYLKIFRLSENAINEIPRKIPIKKTIIL